MYGSQRWTLGETEVLRSRVFERRIYGQYLDPQTEEWRERHNDELRDLLCNRPDIVNEIKRKTPEWAMGHAWRKPEALMKTVLQGDPSGKIPLGRPRLRWEDSVKRDAAGFRTDTDWQTLAENRDGWGLLCLV